jgi:hypothetical protein
MKHHVTAAATFSARNGVEMTGRMVMRRPGADA